jgi:type IV pilus assembly protein PilE
VAVPGWRERVLQARRSDAVDALTRLQAAQEGYRAHHGLYAATLAELGGAGAATSRDGHYRIALQRTAAEAYEARASAQGAQAADAGCAALTLHVTQGFAVAGPKARCWNR